ncbi:hypothetical protein [Palleronia abyssalis]|uniref:Uncharacterized protein n=1 Tax=Palleronia abyssalis TaxID=1501240 RepID=A0A2R8BSK6_9RHOB|nr:hypothetical protein [Palleronia abyssalis]SPJ23154.1 hypothetical protein PAA8504_00959 [Palleronia abyssalis]
MKGWDLFRHSVAMISHNVGAAFRVTGLPYAIILVVTLMFPAVFGVDPDPSPRLGLLFFPAVLLSVLAFLWLAVQWHRYVLTGEIQQGLVPHWHGKLNLAYFGRSILLGLLSIPIFLIAFIPAGLLIAAAPSIWVILLSNTLAFGLAGAIVGRFSPVLPAIAVGHKLSFGDAWRATKGATAPILVMALFLGFLSALPSILIFVGLGIIAVVANLAFQWLITVLSVSVMTTLYGHYVEGRELT